MKIMEIGFAKSTKGLPAFTHDEIRKAIGYIVGFDGQSLDMRAGSRAFWSDELSVYIATWSAKRNNIEIYVQNRDGNGPPLFRVAAPYDEVMQFIRPTHSASREVGAGVLRLAALLLPPAVRGDWLEEHRAYLGDLPTRRAKTRWLYRELRGMVRYAYTVRTSARKEVA